MADSLKERINRLHAKLDRLEAKRDKARAKLVAMLREEFNLHLKGAANEQR